MRAAFKLGPQTCLRPVYSSLFSCSPQTFAHGRCKRQASKRSPYTFCPDESDKSDETLQESSFGIAGEGGVVGFVICHQGAELLSAKGEKMGILVVFGDFKVI